MGPVRRFCHDRGYRAVPATGAVVCDYLLWLEATVDGDGAPAFSVSRIALAAAAIRFVHRHRTAQDHEGGGGVSVWADPLIADTLAAIRRRYARAGDRTPRPQDPIGLKDLAVMVATARDTAHTWRRRIRERRDTALLLLGWVGALRRSELVGLRVGDVRRTHEGWVITVAASKTERVRWFV